MKNETKPISGREAIEYARRTGAQLFTYANPIDAAGPVTIEKAVEIAQEDEGLIYIPGIVRCGCGEFTGVACRWVGPAEETVEVDASDSSVRTWREQHPQLIGTKKPEAQP